MTRSTRISHNKRSPYTLVIIFLVLTSVSFGAYYNSLKQNRDAVEAQTALLTEEVALYFEQELNNRIDLIGLFAQDWLQVVDESELYNEERFYQKVENYALYFSGIKAISWLNTTGHINWRYSINESVSVIGQSVVNNSDGSENVAFSIANSSRIISISNPKTLLIDEFGYVVYYPLIFNGNLTGHMNLVFAVNDFITEMLELKLVAKNYDLLLVDNKAEIYSKGKEIEESDLFCKTGTSPFLTRSWQVFIAPNQSTRRVATFWGNWPILAIGIGASITISIVVFLLMQQSSRLVAALNEKEKMQEVLVQGKKMEAIGRLAGGIAHDFNNLLTAINGFSELTLLDVDENSEIFESLNEINKAGKNAAELTQQLLTFNRKHLIESKIFDFAELITELEPLLNRLISENIRIDCTLPTHPIWIEGDPNQVQQIIVNLVVNSKDAMPEGGVIKMSLKRDMYEYFVKDNFNQKIKPGNYAVFDISDTGIGISEEMKEHIFEPFYTTKEVGRGTGLGLSIVYNIVTQMRGSIGFRTKNNFGTNFQILFPLVEGPLEDVSVDLSTFPENGNHDRSILIAEDDSGVRKFIKKVLKNQGYIVYTAKNGEEALQKLKGDINNIDLLISDVIMPQMGGMRLIQSLEDSQIKTKVLFISGYAERSLNADEFSKISNEFYFMQKPFSAQSLIMKINELLHSKISEKTSEERMDIFTA